MTFLIAAAFAFLALHLLIAGTRVRDAIVSAIGERAYLGLFALASVGGIIWLSMSYRAAMASASNVQLFDLGYGIDNLAIPVVLVAFLLGVPGLLMPSPTSVGQASAAAKEETVRGVLRITRHPFLWGVAIWSAFHFCATGDYASTILFGTFLVLSLLGTLSIDAKRQRKLGDAWSRFAQRTSNVPFAAIASGRNSFRAREYFDWRFLVALALFLAVLILHARVIGVSPFPGGWTPPF
ncbi:MAG TPA: NnrU family protein [Rhizomicrobium sp.]|nr:NnrU family protein [Rhizomicrobium sp.]